MIVEDGTVGDRRQDDVHALLELCGTLRQAHGEHGIAVRTVKNRNGEPQVLAVVRMHLDLEVSMAGVGLGLPHGPFNSCELGLLVKTGDAIEQLLRGG